MVGSTGVVFFCHCVNHTISGSIWISIRAVGAPDNQELIDVMGRTRALTDPGGVSCDSDPKLTRVVIVFGPIGPDLFRV